MKKIIRIGGFALVFLFFSYTPCIATTQIFYNSQDHLYSSSLVTDGDGQVNEQIMYKTFGSVLSDAGHHKEQRKYTGHELDAVTKYTYAGARYLNTDFAQFLSQDPESRDSFEQFLEDPQQLNTYSYARNNPMIFIDRSGEKVELAARNVQQTNLGIHTFVRITPDASNNNSLQHLGFGNLDKLTFGGYSVGPFGGSIGSLYKGLNDPSDFGVVPEDFVGSIVIDKPDQYASQIEFEQAILKGYIALPTNLGAYSILGGDPGMAGQVISNNLSSDLLLKAGVPKAEINSLKKTFPAYGGFLKPVVPGLGIGLPSQKTNSLLDNLSMLQLKLQSFLDYLNVMN